MKILLFNQWWIFDFDSLFAVLSSFVFLLAIGLELELFEAPGFILVTKEWLKWWFYYHQIQPLFLVHGCLHLAECHGWQYCHQGVFHASQWLTLVSCTNNQPPAYVQRPCIWNHKANPLYAQDVWKYHVHVLAMWWQWFSPIPDLLGTKRKIVKICKVIQRKGASLENH